ncbi:hypothetical protein [Engelhardtia mirabilis]|uniref:Uncharacterized protein n=1 Tax=Engelhardtia mirabilis TaxID=2528011 RepID=A0A518BE66_9BACT|nr:hypothetical protein Pla133_03390 [Planctomycetes bacterium Pla133]QDU99601.1 hypothetical protein Pla86_03390 [Planctomycetes bacterium Pla86]
MTAATERRANVLLRISAVLWVIWGLVHLLAGVMTVKGVVTGRTAEAFHAITSKVELSTLELDYPDAVGAVLCQHGFNLGWAGLVTFVCALLVWRANRSAVYLACLVGGLFDLGDFVFIDLGGFAPPRAQ